MRKNLRQPQMASLALFNCMTIKSFGSGQYIGLYDKKMYLEELRGLIETMTAIPRRNQVLVDERGTIINRWNQHEIVGDVYVAIKPTKQDFEEIAVGLGIKQFKSFKLTFLTKEETLDAKEFPNVKDIKNYVQRSYQIKSPNQLLMYKGDELEDSQDLFPLFLKEEARAKELKLNMIVNYKPFDVKIVPIRGHRPFLIRVTESELIFQIMERIQNKLNLPIDHFQLSIKDSDTPLDRDKALKDYEFKTKDNLVLKLQHILKIRLHLVESNEIKEECTIIDEKSGVTTLRKHLKRIRKKNGIKKRGMILIPDDDEGYRWAPSGKHRLIDLLNYSLDFRVQKTWL